MSIEDSRWSEVRQRQALAAIADGAHYLHTADAAGFWDQLENFLGPGLVSLGWQFGVSYTKQDAASLIIHHLLARPEVANACAQADNPWAFLFVCAREWFRRDELGHRGIELDAFPDVIGRSYVEEAVFPEHGLTSLDLVITQTWEVLAPRTPEPLQPPLKRLVEWLGYNPPQRQSYWHLDLQWAVHAFRSFTGEQIKAVANICWGGRPSQATTSIMGGYLRDIDFDPIRSDSHLRALRLYQARMHATVVDPARQR